MDNRPHLSGEERFALLHLSALAGVGDHRVQALRSRFGSAQAALRAPAAEFERVAGAGTAAGRDDPGVRAGVRRVDADCAERGVRVLASGFQGYPLALEPLDVPPPVLFALGRTAADRPRRVVVVGARRASAYGRRVARRLGRELAEQGCTVISGMALGIDGEAHAGALEGGGVTLAVLGSGPDEAYPSVHRPLHRRIVSSGGILSEHPPGTKALPHHFPRRNRILAGLAEAVVVVEAAERSGSLITAGASASATVFAVPGSVESALSRGTFALLRDGAAPAAGADDVLQVMGWPPLRPDGGAIETPEGLGRVEAALWGRMGGEPWALDDLARAIDAPPVRILSALGVLEVGGWVHAVPGGRYIRGAGPADTGSPGAGLSGGGRS